jgi:ectoine hydroxylase-related dioxygenase (phytanoyl-CoA dioxygenase family)
MPMPALQTFPHDTPSTPILAAIAQDGACIVHDLLDSAFCDGIAADFGNHLEAVPWGDDQLGYRDAFYGQQTKRLHGLFSKSPKMVEVLTNPLLLQVARELLVNEDRGRDIRLSNTELMVLGQDQPVQVFHTDGGSWHRAQRQEQLLGPLNEILISANIALTPFTASNGATRVVPGSHLWSPEREPQPAEICQAIMPKGSALLYSGNVIHSGGANATSTTRVGLYLGYVVSWLRPLENYLVTNKPEDIFALTPEAQQLLDISPGGFTVMA